MAQAPRDENRVPAGLGVSDTDGVTTLPFYVDSVTGRVLLALSATTSNTGTVAGVPAARDANRVTDMIATNSDDSGYGQAAIDSRNLYLYLDLVVE